MPIYRVPRMTVDDYNSYMGGGNNYHVDVVEIFADSPEEAINKVDRAGYVIDKHNVKTVDEYNRETSERDARQKAGLDKLRADKASKDARQKELLQNKAAKAGVKPENVEEWGKLQKKLQRIDYDIRKNESSIRDLQSKVDELRKSYADTSEKINRLMGKTDTLDDYGNEPNQDLLDRM